MAPVICSDCGAPLAHRQDVCDHGKRAEAGPLSTSAKQPIPYRGTAGPLDVVTVGQAKPAAPAAAATLDDAVAEVKAGLIKAGYAEPIADSMAKDAVAHRKEASEFFAGGPAADSGA
jgi:hypothetical protein